MITLLAIDDDPRTLALIAATLKQDGLEILTCEDPEKAVAIVGQRLPRIVICDLVMPKLSGMEVLHKIASIDPTIEVILLTGHYSAETAVEAIRDGACDYLTKPIAPDRLRARVDELLAEARRVQRAGLLDDELIEDPPVSRHDRPWSRDDGRLWADSPDRATLPHGVDHGCNGNRKGIGRSRTSRA